MTEEINKWLYAFKYIKAAPFLLQLLYETDTSRANNAIISVSLGAAGIGTSTARYIIPPQPIKPILPPFTTNRLHPSAHSLLLSLSFGLVGAIIAGILSYLIQNRSAIIEPIVKFIRLDSKHTS